MKMKYRHFQDDGKVSEHISLAALKPGDYVFAYIWFQKCWRLWDSGHLEETDFIQERGE